ncbi:unnamed protein product [Didymodactylos carnosus]|uniref:Ankyrin repeat domain-containing protein 53 n=1 Tax=Didymodactylos carnosus TaxID=1234261 RepID=A0A8S2D1N4_9BILA|nr:unnamed protein product [Didymodactylos carnosus]CAF3573980.1 unnamed protein product [Didymodactylos carnosus]
MLSDETISNLKLCRNTRQEPPSVSLAVSQNQLQLPTLQRKKIDRVPSSRSSKSVIDAKKRSVSDACMAAAIGDLNWLKQSLKDSYTEHTYGKEVERLGLAPIHLAALHGRLNCLAYLVETIHIDVNMPSTTGWRPIHLCINKETDKRAYQCLDYLIKHGALLNITNDDNLTPIHQAASDGHVQCLELLLQHDADVYAEDSRKQLPIDLAKLWGHKKCAKLLAAAMWHQNKHISAKHRLLAKRSKMQDILNEIKSEHALLFEEKGEEKFDQWLVNMGVTPPEKIKTETKQIESKEKPLTPEIQSGLKREHSHTKVSSSKTRETTSDTIDTETLLGEQESVHHSNIIQTKSALTNVIGTKRWNYSTHVKQNSYIPGLADTYPRDPYTMMPVEAEAIDVYRMLKGMTINDVRQFLSKTLSTRKSMPLKSKSRERQVVFASCHVDDLERKHLTLNDETKYSRFDESGCHMSDDPQSIFYQRLSQTLKQQVPKENRTNDDEEKFQLFDQYGPELVAFLRDRNGNFKQKFDKVFIT